jgi:hypothetical protein
MLLCFSVCISQSYKSDGIAKILCTFNRAYPRTKFDLKTSFKICKFPYVIISEFISKLNCLNEIVYT